MVMDDMSDVWRIKLSSIKAGAGSECTADVYVLYVCSHDSSTGIVCATVAI